jgi:hypothetical protein
MADSIKEKESFDKLIHVLEVAVKAAAKILGPNVRSALLSRDRPLEHPSQVYEALSDVLDAAREGRVRLLERS